MGIYTATYTGGTEAGVVEIQAKTSNGKIGKDVLTLKAEDQPTFGTISAISFASAPTQMIAGETFQFSLIASDVAGLTQALDNRDGVWTVSDGIGTISDTGELTVTAVGNAKVKATLISNALLTAETSTITVISALAENVKVTVVPDSLVAGSGETATVNITVTDTFGNTVTGQTITLTASDGDVSATATEVGDGVYNATYTAGTNAGDIEIRATTLDGVVGIAEVTLSDTPQTSTFELSTTNTEVTVMADD